MSEHIRFPKEAWILLLAGLCWLWMAPGHGFIFRVLATVPGISHTYDKEWGESWCWNFTPMSIRRLFAETFSLKNVEVKSYGNVFAAAAFLYGLADQELDHEELEYRDPGYEVAIAVRARKL